MKTKIAMRQGGLTRSFWSNRCMKPPYVLACAPAKIYALITHGRDPFTAGTHAHININTGRARARARARWVDECIDRM